MLKASHFFLSLIFLTTSSSACSSGSPQPPAFVSGSKITAENAVNVTVFDATDVTSVVDYYFAARIRGDEKWMEVLPPQEAWTDRMKRKLADHAEWTFTGYQFQEVDGQEAGRLSANVYMEIEYKGEADSGVDNVLLEQADGKWVIVEVPT